MTIKFEVPGVAVPKQSFRVLKDGKVQGYQDKRVTIWQEYIGSYANVAYQGEPLTGDIGISLYFWLPNKHRRDLDNLSKAVLDALKWHFYKDDTQVIDLHIRKGIDALNPRVEIDVWWV